MPRLKGYLKFVSLFFLILSFVSLILTFMNQGVIQDISGSNVSWIHTMFSIFPMWLGLYPLSVFFLLVSFIALFIRETKKRFILYLFDIVIVGAFTLFSKYVLKENRPGIILSLIIAACLMLLTVFALIVVFYKPKKTANPKKAKRIEEKKDDKETEKIIKDEDKEAERQQRIREAELRRQEREQKAREKEEQRRAELEKRRLALEEQRARRENELKEREERRQREIDERRQRKEEEIQRRMEEARLREEQRKEEMMRRTAERQEAIQSRLQRVSTGEQQRNSNMPLSHTTPTQNILQQAPSREVLPPTSNYSNTTIAPINNTNTMNEQKDDEWDEVITIDDDETDNNYVSNFTSSATRNNYIAPSTDIRRPETQPPQETNRMVSNRPTYIKPEQNNSTLPKDEGDDEVSGIGGLAEKSTVPRSFRYTPPTINLLDEHPSKRPPSSQMELEIQMTTLIETLKSYGINCERDGYIQGPTVTLFKIIPSIGVKASKIVSLTDDIARNLEVASSSVRVLSTIPGTRSMGIEIPNISRQMVSFKSLVPSLITRNLLLPFSLGQTITGEIKEIDITKTPHLLIAGATGSGKSVCVNSMIASLLYKKGPGEVRMIMVDPKVVELQMYNGIPHLLTPVITEPKKAIKALDFAIEEMERRYRILEQQHVRNITGYNEKLIQDKIKRERMPYILIIVDEFADLMSVVGKELEARIARLAAKARAVGIHLVLATQRPSVDVITGTLKNNLPSRIAFRVPSGTDSRTIIDVYGAEKLLGNGDMLYKAPDAAEPVRIQGAFLSDEETERIVEYCKTQGTPTYIDESWFEEQETDENFDDDYGDDYDTSTDVDEAQIERAWAICAESKKCSTSYIQRRLHIGYNAAANIVEELEARGIVGPQQGSKPREVLKFPG